MANARMNADVESNAYVKTEVKLEEKTDYLGSKEEERAQDVEEWNKLILLSLNPALGLSEVNTPELSPWGCICGMIAEEDS